MLEFVSHVPWTSYTTAYNDADQIPHRFWQTQSGSAHDRDQAWAFFNQHVYHQGTIYDSIVVLVPFFLALLRTPTAYQPDRIAEFLATVVLGVPRTSTSTGPYLLARYPMWATLTDQQRNRIVRDLVREVVALHVSALYPYVSVPYDGREAIAIALTRFPDHAAQSIETLNEAITLEPDERIRTVMNLSVSVLSGATLRPEYYEMLNLPE